MKVLKFIRAIAKGVLTVIKWLIDPKPENPKEKEQ